MEMRYGIEGHRAVVLQSIKWLHSLDRRQSKKVLGKAAGARLPRVSFSHSFQEPICVGGRRCEIRHVLSSMLLNMEKRVAISPARSADGATRLNPGVQDSQLKSKAYRRYAAGVERALGLFDSALQEWADYIAFLGRLQKALQAQPNDISVIPDKRTVARRLAQCLNPSLPSGVHQKTLELYDMAFELQGKENLSRDLSLYLPGISSTLTFASLTVRPIFLSLVEDHLLKLPTITLRPALKAIILSLLPGIEDETSEDFDRVLDILDKFKDLFNRAGSEGIFWQCLFLASVTSSSRRLGALAYLTRRLPMLGPNPSTLADNGKSEAVMALTDPEPGLLIRCFSTGLLDEQILVQRTFLDLLVTHLPLNAGFYKEKVTAEDMKVLVTAAVSVVLRRDMSLNRRLWSWFLGPENPLTTNGHGVPTSPEESKNQSALPLDAPTSHGSSSYFETYGVVLLVASLESMIARKPTSPSEQAQPLRIALSLMDRWEIGGPAVSALFLPLLRSVQDFVSTSSQEAADIVLRSANIFFDGVESSLIWSKILQLTDNKAQEDLRLAKFIITTFNVREEEMLKLHIPMVMLALICILRRSPQSSEEPARSLLQSGWAPRSNIAEMIELLAHLIPDGAFGETPTKDSSKGSSDTLEIIKAFYMDIGGSLILPRMPFSPSELGRLILRHTAFLFISHLESDDGLVEQLSRVVVTVTSKISNLYIFAEMAEAMLTKMVAGGLPDGFSFVSSITSVVVSVCTSQEHLAAIIPILVEQLWHYLQPDTPQHHIEAARQICGLHAVSSHSRLVESKIALLMISPGPPHTPEDEKSAKSSHGLHIDAIKKFGVLWNHSSNIDLAQSMLDGPLVLIIDALASPGTSPAAKEWLQGTSAQSLARVFRVAILPLVRSNELVMTSLQRLADIISAQSAQQYSRFANEPEWTKIVLTDSPVPEFVATLQAMITQLCVSMLQKDDLPTAARDRALNLLKELLTGPSGEVLVSENLEALLLSKLDQSLQFDDTKFQNNLIETLLAFLDLKLKQLRSVKPSSTPKPQHRRLTSRDNAGNDVQLSVETQTRPSSAQSVHYAKPSPQFLACVRKGLAADQARPILDKWVVLLCELVPLYSQSMYQILIALVESLCKEITKTFAQLKSLFSSSSPFPLPLVRGDVLQSDVPALAVREDLEWSLGHLLSGLEYILAQAHLQLAADESQLVSAKTPDQPQGLFGSMVSGASSGSEGNQVRNTIANNRLTVVLCFQDSIRVLVDLWSWEKLGATSSLDSIASFLYLSSKLRHRSRRILEHLLEAEPLEGLETLVELWARAAKAESVINTPPVLDLFQTLNASRPRTTVPAVFNAIYSRTNPTVLNKHQRSTLSSNLAENELVSFLVHYSSSLEDDVLDEIWTDCTTFLRDVLGNPMPHRRILPGLLEFIAVIGRKMENTNFGEESKMRRELGDIFVRLLTAIFTISPAGQGTDNLARAESRIGPSKGNAQKQNSLGSADIVEILCDTLPSMNHILGESDRLVGLVSSISAQIIGPMIRSRLFPKTMSQPLLKLMQIISRVSNASKLWKKDVYDALNDPRFFLNSPAIVREGWLPVFTQLNNADKALLTELSSRLTTPAAAGLMFGVGASAARLDADRKTQLNLRRLAIVILAAEDDTIHVATVRTKIEETLTATRVSSPSSLTRAEVFMLVRALALKSTSTQLAPIWPAISAELLDVFSSVIEEHSEAYNGFSLLQAAKLLDLLLVVQPDEFQLHEWLFVTDTLDAIYPPDYWRSSALIDEVAQSANQAETPMTAHPGHLSEPSNELRRPWLCSDATRGVDQGDVLDKLLRPFFGQLSIHAFESTYRLGHVDREACVDDLIGDLFNDETIAS